MFLCTKVAKTLRNKCFAHHKENILNNLCVCVSKMYWFRVKFKLERTVGEAPGLAVGNITVGFFSFSMPVAASYWRGHTTFPIEMYRSLWVEKSSMYLILAFKLLCPFTFNFHFDLEPVLSCITEFCNVHPVNLLFYLYCVFSHLRCYIVNVKSISLPID